MVYIFEKTVKTRYGTYIYVCLGEAEWVNGRSQRSRELILWRKDAQGQGWLNLAQKLAPKKPRPTCYEFGLVTALWATCKEYGVVNIIDRHVGKRDQGPSPGEYVAVLAINRAVALNSKSAVGDWFARTTLPRQFPDLAGTLTPQNIWNHMGYLGQDTIRQIEQELCKAVLATFAPLPGCFLFDPTNFFTYIREHGRNSVARRGHNKKKRNDLRQVNVSLLVTRGDCNMPVMHETYEGNVPDPSHFKTVLPLMEQRFQALGLEIPSITLVFDKGNNSPDAYRFLAKKGIHFVSSVRPSMKKVKPLAGMPLSKFEVLWVKPGGSKVLGYREATTLYLGKENTLVVTYDDDTYALQEYNLDKAIAKATGALAAFAKESLNRKPQWKDKGAVAKKVERDILRTKALRALVRYTVTAAKDCLELSWRVDEDARAEAAKGLGKSFLFTNRNDWTSLEIAKTYRAQKGVEDQFKELNDRDRVSVMPMYHYTDQKIRAHIFISILALLLSNLLYRKLQQGGITESKEACLEALADIKEIKLDYDGDVPPAYHVTAMSLLQQKIAAILDLKCFFPT